MYLPDALESLIMQVPPVDDLPLSTWNAEACMTLWKAVRKKAHEQPESPSSQSSGGIFTSVWLGHETSETHVNPRFYSVCSVQCIFYLDIDCFHCFNCVPSCVHVFYYCFNFAGRFFPEESSFTKTAIKRMLQLISECSAELYTKLSKRYRLVPHSYLEAPLPFTCAAPPNREPKQSSSSFQFAPLDLFPPNQSLCHSVPRVTQKENKCSSLDKKVTETTISLWKTK